MDWDLPQLRALAAIVDNGSLEGAARALHVTPSAVSQRLKALERSAGAVLVRRTRPVTPTEAGVAVVLLARQIEALTQAAPLASATSEAGELPVVRLAVNADSLATWTLAALAPLAHQVRIEFLREDESHTATLLRDGTAMAAITSERVPVQGCTVTPLGAMRYRPLASPSFVARYFPDGVTPAALALAPVVAFDANDTLQDGLLLDAGVDPRVPPRHVVPASTEFAEAVRLGYGWGLLPDQQVAHWQPGEATGLAGHAHRDVELYWQQWSLHTPSLDAVAGAVRAAAARALRQPGAPRP